jgi:hypothetical protein
MAWTPVLPKAAPVGSLSARRRSSWPKNVRSLTTPKRKFVASDRMSPIEVNQPFRIAAAWESQLGNPVEAKNASFREKTPR